MLQKVLNFIKYHNAFTIIFVVVFFGFGIGLAASPQMRDSIYSSEEIVVSVDNGLLVSADLDNFNFNLRITSITEDENNYYATYSYQTLTIENSVWQQREVEKTLTVSKETLAGKDLGLYLAEELGENINYELSYLKRVQKLEKEKGESQKVVTVEYSGLIGRLLNPEEKVIEGYSPVIPEPVAEETPVVVESNPELAAVSAPLSESSDSAESAPDTSSEDTSNTAEPAPEQTEPTEEATSTPSQIEPEPEATSTPPQIEPEPTPEPEATSTPPQIEPEPEATSTPPQIEPEPEPAPEPEATSTPPQIEPEPEPAPESEATSTPPESTQ